MRKIESLFQREGQGKKFLAVQRWNEECLWVPANPSARPSAKIDGTACLMREDRFYKRLELKQGKDAPGWIHWTFDTAQPFGHGWIPVGNGPEDAWHREAMESFTDYVEGATYELVGPRIQSNPHNLLRHELWRHGAIRVEIELPLEAETAFEIVRAKVEEIPYEGIVWRSAKNGDYAKIKRRDFGLPWPLKPSAK